MKNQYRNIVGVISLLFCTVANAQDKAVPSLYESRLAQRDMGIVFGQEFYANRAYMMKYSDLSFSELSANYQSDRKDAYLLQDGDGLDAFKVNTSSYQRLKGNKIIWGSASYTTQKQKNMKWNENMDRHILGPYVVGDSVGGTMKQDIYQFTGGIAKQLARWTVGGEVSYIAKSGYREIDPRPKNTTSDLNIHLGVSYNLYRDYELGVYTKWNKYTQNSSLQFVNLLGKPIAYHLTGLGAYNYYFSSAVNMTTIYEGTGYDVGGTIAKNGGKDFLVQASFGQFSVLKGFSSNPSKDMSELKTKKYTVGAIKYVDINEHRLGAKVNYLLTESRGTEYFYSKVGKLEQKIAEKELYKFVRSDIYTSLFYQYSTEVSRLIVSPSFTIEQTDEKRRDTFAKQRFTYLHYGVEVDYMRQINQTSAITVSPYLRVRNLKESTVNNIESYKSPAMTEWTLHDLAVKSSNYQSYGATARYDVKFNNIPTMFAQVQYEQTRYNINKTNSYIGMSLGVTF
ncbi:hypothetical protein HX017_12815 [Myroides marinus]|uniref:DUF6850 family outer membrane beta-barrel protein n=1 Tax=Myroides marinus TaxID=703342 RepID=UPI002574E82D|nr:DUF6850 family outer membrane beta-barrel protein [Myroides marinus]MDM1348075.1 hypothetical protein [Myroides marinus]MDM1351635.1 hypothetical protein [Myroides marinus]MDM1355229.1 hypothetical protein [Myroides marinus]MDM1358842.1 hypothetical protein [Myroides marinus]MDM1361331.1 hypothetical protein [Myroides marinus]